MPFLLIASKDGELLRSIDLSHRRKLTVGRSTRSDVRIGAPSVSRHHTVLFRHGSRWLLADAGSTTGTFTGSDEEEARLRLSELASDSWIRVGPAYFWLDDDEGGARPVTGRSAILQARSGDTMAPVDDPVLDRISSFGAGHASEPEPHDETRLRIRDSACVPRLEVKLGGRECVTIGRDKACDIAIDVESVSALHAALYLDGRRWCVLDLGSANGTFVEGHRVVRQALEDYMVISIGPTIMTISGCRIGKRDGDRDEVQPAESNRETASGNLAPASTEKR
jgi:pSer/pThr/pTyr-binding forkhead associated (FHA) protein